MRSGIWLQLRLLTLNSFRAMEDCIMYTFAVGVTILIMCREAHKAPDLITMHAHCIVRGMWCIVMAY